MLLEGPSIASTAALLFRNRQVALPEIAECFGTDALRDVHYLRKPECDRKVWVQPMDSHPFKQWDQKIWTRISVFGCSAYVVLFALPTKWDISLALLAIVTIASSLFASSNKVGFKHYITVILVLFIVYNIISVFVSSNIRISSAFGLSLLPSLLIYYLINWRFSGLSHIRILYAAFTILALCLSIGLVVTALANSGGNPLVWIEKFPSPIIVVPNDLILLAVIFPFTLCFLRKDARTAFILIAVASLAVSVIAIIAFQSRGAIIALVAGALVYLWLTSRRLSIILVAAILFLALITDAVMGFPLLSKFGQFSDARIPLWIAAWGMFVDAPILGFGPHTYGLFYQSYLETARLPEFSVVEPRFTPWPHNLYLEVLAEQGLIGLTILMLLLAAALNRAWKLVQARSHDTRRYGIAALASLLVICLAGLYELTFLRLWLPIILFSILGVISLLDHVADQRVEQTNDVLF
jgi:O-antigen ligase